MDVEVDLHTWKQANPFATNAEPEDPFDLGEVSIEDCYDDEYF